MNLGEIRAAVAGRGFDHLPSSQVDADINDVRELLDHMYLWPYREASATGPAPLSIGDLGTVEAVLDLDLDVPLRPAKWGWLLSMFGDLSLTGSPEFFYVATPDGTTPAVATYPVGSGSIGVQYYKVTSSLDVDSDEPEAPDRFHSLLVDMAVQRAYMRTDQFQAAQALQPFVDQRLSVMVGQLLGGQQIAGPSDVVPILDGSCDS